MIHIHGNISCRTGHIEIDGRRRVGITVGRGIVVDDAIAHRQREVGPLVRSGIEGSPPFADTVLDDAVAYDVARHRTAGDRSHLRIDHHDDTAAVFDKRRLIACLGGIAVDDMEAVEYGIGNFLENDTMVNKLLIAHLTVDDRTVHDGIPQGTVGTSKRPGVPAVNLYP